MILSNSLKVFLGSTLLAVAGLQAEDLDLKKAAGSLIDAEISYDKLANEKNFAARTFGRFAPATLDQAGGQDSPSGSAPRLPELHLPRS